MKKFKLEVLYEDNHLICVNKPAGILVQGDRTGDKPLVDFVKDYIRVKYDKPGKVFCGVIHRIDRPVSGVVMFARTSKGLERMNALLREKKIYKTYWAIVKKRPPKDADRLMNYLIKNPEKNTSSVVEKSEEGGLRSELSYRRMGKLNNHHLLEVYPVTGRPHQIRVQLSHMGSPIRGDIKYGFKKPNEDASINLHARELRFEHPIKKEKILIVAPLPSEPFWEQFLTLKKQSDKDINLLT